MKAIREVLRDRRRAQRGSVLSGVLIITAFVAIISGALTTELSTNFLLSRNLMTRVDNQATVDSAIELAVSQLQAAPLNQPCPSLTPVTLNNRTASAAAFGCWPTVRQGETQFASIGSTSSSFNVDGTIGANGDYVVGDSGGNLLDYRFGAGSPRWTLGLGGMVTAAPLVIPDPSSPGRFLDAVPLWGPSCSGGSGYCLRVWSDGNAGLSPAAYCSVSTAEPVATQPAVSPSVRVLYFAHGTTLVANDMTQTGGTCDPGQVTSSISGGGPVVAGPVAFRCTGGCGQVSDYVYVVTADSGSSRLYEYSYRDGAETLQLQSSTSLPWANASQIAVQGTTLPTNVVVTFQGGGVELIHLNSNGSMSLTASRQISGGISGAPYWCSACGLIGVGAQNGGLYLLDTSLNLVATYLSGAAIYTTPGVDGAGNWYFAADDGYVHEAQLQGGQLVQVNRYGPTSAARSSVRVGGCPTGICVYFGSVNGNLYLVPLDARDAVLSACISQAPPACSGANPRVWASVEVGASGSPTAVHVQGWSYYSP